MKEKALLLAIHNIVILLIGIHLLLQSVLQLGLLLRVPFQRLLPDFHHLENMPTGVQRALEGLTSLLPEFVTALLLVEALLLDIAVD